MPSSVMLLLAIPLLLVACAAAPPGDPKPPAAAAPVPEAGQPRRPLQETALLTTGADALSSGDAQAALALFDGYIAIDAGSSMAHFLRGVALLDLGRTQDACDSLTESVRLDPEDAGGYSVLARVLYDLDRLDEAVSALQRAIELDASPARHWTSLGLLYYESDEWADAYDAFRQAVERDPSDAEAHRGLARLYVAVDEMEMAERAYRTAIELRPDDPELHVALGHVLRDVKRGADALGCYRAAIALSPGNPWIEANLGSTCLELGRPAEAQSWFERCVDEIEGPPIDAALVRMNYAMSLRDVGDVDGAMLFFEEALAKDASLGPAHEALGLLHFDMGHRDEAREHLQQAFLMVSLAPEGIVHLTGLHEDAAEWERALQTAAVLLESPSDGGELDYRRAQLLVRSEHSEIRDTGRAVTELRSLLAGPLGGHAASWMLLAEALTAEGRIEQAVVALDRAMGSVSPRDPLVKRAEEQRAQLVGRLADER